MNIKLTQEIIFDDLEKEKAATKRQAAIQAIDIDCAAFNGAKKAIFDHLNTTIEALKGNPELDAMYETEKALCAVINAKTQLDVLFKTLYQIWLGNY